MKLIVATAIVALTLPVLSLADVSGTATLTATTGALNLDAGSTAASGGDLLWNGTTLTPQGGATAATLTGFNSTTYGAITQTLLSTLLSELALAGASLNAPHYTSGEFGDRCENQRWQLRQGPGDLQ
jgi:hypothetical protein